MKPDPANVSRGELRNFGLLMCGAFAVIACLRWWIKGHAPTVLFVIAAAFLVFGLAAPVALKPVYRAWMKFALALNWVMTRVFLTIAFYGLITPTGIIYRLVAGDPLKRAWDPHAGSYWEAPDDQPGELDAYKNQF
ncbi:MAG: hypothetical protein HUU46_14960 [Candidatus Hydrogenedentes bacterium]|nr:hypothetical protein [Candidatus Hydrogenedentota bacterium]